MTDLLLDTHAWIWTVLNNPRATSTIRTMIISANSALLSVSSLYEVAYKARLGKWPEVAPFAEHLEQLANQQGVQIVDISPKIAIGAAQLDWTHRDPFDRLIAATAISRRATLISADAQFDDLKNRPEWLGRLW